jgi:non-heme chloroperoxidase
VFSHGWPLNADSWEAQMVFPASNGYRCTAHDRRGHGRSSQPWGGNDMDTYADDLATLIATLDLKDAVLIGFSTGGGAVARYIGRHGTTRVAEAALIATPTCWRSSRKGGSTDLIAEAIAVILWTGR